MAKKRVAVIGAGPSGLTATKTCLEEELEVVCFERNDHAGGLWKYREEDIDGVASVMKTTIINTNKQLSAFSDFPPPEDYPNFMHNRQMCEYFMQYAEKFGVLQHIRYNKEVINVVPAEDTTGEKNGRWYVTTKDKMTGEVTDETFDAVMVCIGHHVFPKMPNFPGQDTFKGRILHSHSLKTTESFKDLNVVVLGIGNSGADATVDSTYTAKQVYLGTRRGTWLFARVGPRGDAYDFAFANRFKMFLSQFKSFDSVCDAIEERLNERFDHELYNLKPKHRVLSAHPTANDNLPNLILAGRVVVKGNIERFLEDGVIFEGDTEMTKVDVVVFATGYHIKFPFIREDVLPIKDNILSLYKYCIPPKYPTLSIIAQVQPLGPIFPVGEMMSRWFVRLLTGKTQLPSVMEMESNILAKREANAKRYVSSTRHTIQVDFVPFLDELASLIGVKPNLTKLAFTDPKLFWTCLMEPCLPFQYRLQGPHKWDGARDALMNYKKSFKKPLSTRVKEPQTQNAACSTCYLRSFSYLFLIIVVAILAVVLSYVF